LRNAAVLFAGDFCPINRTEKSALNGKPDVVFGDVLAELRNKDLSIVNLECPLTRTRTKSPLPKIVPNLRADPKVVECIKVACFDVVNLANNHIVDQGPSGLDETIRLLQSNRIGYVGAGSSVSVAQKPLKVNCNGISMTFLAFAENEFNSADDKQPGSWPLEPAANISQIKRAETSSDVVIVLVHGGNEYNPVPSPRIVKTYRAFVDAGASAVIATHPHVPQGYEVLNGAPIFYSLGNFVFDRPQREIPSPLWSKSYMVRLRFQSNTVEGIDIIPYKTSTQTGCLTLLKGREHDEFMQYLDFLSGILRDEGEIEKYWHGWCALRGPGYFRQLSLCSPLGFVYSSFPACVNSVGMKCLLMTRNLVTCEAHHEILSTYLDLVRKKQVGAASEYLPVIRSLQKGKVPSSN